MLRASKCVLRASLPEMNVGELCIREVVIIREDESVVDAARVMREYHVGDLVVVREREHRRVPIGILTDRDLAIEVVAQAADKIHLLTVADVASTSSTNGIVMLREEDPAEKALDRMIEHGVRRIPVVDERGALVGIVAYDDLVEHLAGQLTRLAKIPSRQADQERRRRP